MAGDIRAYVDLDWTTWHCPCGASHCNRYNQGGETTAWLAEHAPHSSGFETEHITADGARCLGGKIPEPTRRPLSRKEGA